MRRYFSVFHEGNIERDGYPVTMTGDTVFELEPASRKTGVLDPRGNPIFAKDEREPIGFAFMRHA